MFTPSKALFVIGSVLISAFASAQSARLDPKSTIHITLPEGSPVTVMSADWGESTFNPRGGAMLLDLIPRFPYETQVRERFEALRCWCNRRK